MTFFPGRDTQLHQQYVKENRFDGITCDEYLALLTDHQWEDRENNKIDRLLKLANFRQNASLGDINYVSERNLDKNMFSRLGTLDFHFERRTSLYEALPVRAKAIFHRLLDIRPALLDIPDHVDPTQRYQFAAIKLA